MDRQARQYHGGAVHKPSSHAGCHEPAAAERIVITMEDREGKLFRYVVMETRTGWGADYPPEKRNSRWEFQAFNPDKTVNRNENLDRCFACHKGQAGQIWCSRSST